MAVTLLFRRVHVVTMDGERREFADGYLAVEDNRVVGVGDDVDCPYDTAQRVVDGTGMALLPGFVNAHTHAIHVLMRGGLSDDRSLYDWLFNVILPGLAVYQREDVALAARFYCHESLRAGVTTFVDNVEFPVERFDMAAEAALDVYQGSGLRVAYARMFYDTSPADFDDVVAEVEAREPSVRHDPGGFETAATAMASIEGLLKRYHGTADGRIQVWPSPGVAILCTREGLLAAKDLAGRYGSRITLHLAESSVDRLQAGMTSIEYLASIGFLGPEVLAGHCVQASPRDIDILAEHDVKVANNAVSNMFLASGIAPVVEMQAAGVTVGLGTDDANGNNSVNVLADMKVVALAQKARTGRADAITAEKVLEMVTIDGARAVGMADDVGSLEVGKKADVVMVDLRGSHLWPRHSVASVLVYQANGSEVDTVVVDGRVLLEGGRVVLRPGEDDEDTLRARVQAASERIAAAARLTDYPRRAPRPLGS